MNELLAFVYDREEKADSIKAALLRIETSKLVDLEDMVVVHKGLDGEAVLEDPSNMTGMAAAAGGFWGVLLGFAVAIPFTGGVAFPLLAGALGAGMGAIGGKALDIGIDDAFGQRCAQVLEPGHSVLFVLARSGRGQAVVDVVRNLGSATLLRTPLSDSFEEDLQRALRSVEQSHKEGTVRDTMPMAVREETF